MANIKVGKPDVKPDASSHIKGVPQGNVGPNESQPGHHTDGTADARRSTAIRPAKRDPITKGMPNLPPG
jgi:hypothetical protein